MTSSEAEASFIARCEKDLQKKIAAWLSRNSLPFINPPMHRKSALPVGWPDFTFSIHGRACAVEAKHDKNKPSKEQIEKRNELIAAGWLVATIFTYAEFLAFVKQAGWKDAI